MNPNLLRLVSFACAVLAVTGRCFAASAEEVETLAKRVLAETSGRIIAPTLKRPVTVLRDPWGVAHIYAEAQADLFFAQGFVAAQDRLWQLDLWRRVGE